MIRAMPYYLTLPGNTQTVIIICLQVSDLQYASPATVSRCGMVFVDPKNLGYEPFWKRWINGKHSLMIVSM